MSGKDDIRASRAHPDFHLDLRRLSHFASLTHHRRHQRQPACNVQDRRHSSPDRQRHRGEGESRIEIRLRDLDCERRDVTCAVRPGTSTSKLDYVLRELCIVPGPVPDDALILFYRAGRELRIGTAISESDETIFYRVLHASDDGSLKIQWSGENSNPLADRAFGDQLVRDIHGGITLGDVRLSFSRKLGIEDANRIVVVARGGIRPGHLEGNIWETCQIRMWLCRCLSIEVRPSQEYILVRGLGREYIYHPSSSTGSRVVVRLIKTWIHKQLLTRVGQHGATRVDMRTRDVMLTQDGRLVEGFSHLAWGSTVDFSLRDDRAAEIFSREETWLLPATETCTVCCDGKRITEMPFRITAGCDHKPSLCISCLQQWLVSSLADVTWDRLQCPECAELLKYDDVRRCGSEEFFERYDALAARAAIQEIRNFHWCLGPRCTSGQIHNDGCPKFRCYACKHRHCIVHSVPWHRGKTCDEYDRHNRRRRREEMESEKIVKEISKRCPECHRDVHKFSGCNHITCVCGHEWCYICFAPYRTTPAGFLRCQHDGGCTERDIFADLDAMPDFMAPPPMPPRPPTFPFDRRPPNPFRPRTPPPPPPAHPRDDDHGRTPEVQVNDEAARVDNSDTGSEITHVPPAAPPPPRFAVIPPRIREEMLMENARRRRAAERAHPLVDIAFAGLAAAAAVVRAQDRMRHA